MHADQLIWFVAGGIAVLVVLFVIRLFRQPNDEGMTFPPTSAERHASPPICFAGQIPYGVDKRPMPTGDNLDVLLPGQVGSFVRGPIRVPKDIHHDPIYADYQCGDSSVFVELGVCDSASGSQRAIMNAKRETDAEFPDVPCQRVLGAEPSYLRTVNKLGAFFAWTRGGYYFSAHAKQGEADLDAFMQAFPY
jgi:hypothetical protein